MRWMYNSGDEEKKTYTYDSTGKGNYSDSKDATGSNEAYAVNNIYDMAGNVYDWTIEASHANGRVLRGGFFGYGVSISPASFRNYNNASDSGSLYGSRLALYV